MFRAFTSGGLELFFFYKMSYKIDERSDDRLPRGQEAPDGAGKLVVASFTNY
jgi:hypothetical protein